MNFVEKIMHYYPNAEWAMSSITDYGTLRWQGPGDKPTQEELEALPEPPPPPIPIGTLELDKPVILADNDDTAEVTIQSGSTVHFVIDDEVHAVEPEDDVATLFVKANAPGPIRIEVENQRVMIVAQEVAV